MRITRTRIVFVTLVAACVLGAPANVFAGKKEEKRAAEAAELAALAQLRLMHTLPVPEGVSAEKVRQSVVRCLNLRHWMILEDEGGRILASYHRQPVTVALTVRYDTQAVEIWSKGSGDLEKLKKKEAQWLANVVKDVTEAMAAESGS